LILLFDKQNLVVQSTVQFVLIGASATNFILKIQDRLLGFWFLNIKNKNPTSQ